MGPCRFCTDISSACDANSRGLKNACGGDCDGSVVPPLSDEELLLIGCVSISAVSVESFSYMPVTRSFSYM